MRLRYRVLLFITLPLWFPFALLCGIIGLLWSIFDGGITDFIRASNSMKDKNE